MTALGSGATLDIQLLEGKLVLWKRLGYGAMNAQIFRGTHADYGDVVCKIIPIPPDELEAARMRQYVDSEADCGRRLQSPHIRKLHDDGVFETLPELVLPEGAVYLIFEWVPAALDDILRNGPPAPRQVLRLAHALAAGLKVAHDSLPPIYHRDLKPQNVLVVDREDLRTAKVADFGIARMAGGTRVTSIQSWAGTELYMAPEQFESSATVNERADIYALALLLWECLTGTLPLRAESVSELRRLRRHPTFPALVVDGAPRPEVFNILRWALQPDPSSRPDSVEKLVRGFAETGVADGLWTERDREAAAVSAPPPVPRVLMPPERGKDERASGGALELRLPLSIAGILKQVTPGVEWTYSLVREVWSTISDRVGLTEVTRILELASTRERVSLVHEDSPPYVIEPATPLAATGAGGRVASDRRGAGQASRAGGRRTAARAATGSGARASSTEGLARPASAAAPAPLVRASAVLAEIVGDEPMPRYAVANRVWEYIQRHGLQHAADQNTILADERLMQVFGGRTSVSIRDMTTLVNRHLTDA